MPLLPILLGVSIGQMSRARPLFIVAGFVLVFSGAAILLSIFTRSLERYFKGAANHRRIAILSIVDKREGITVEKIAEALEANFKTISQHTRSLVHAGLLNKNYQGRKVTHALSPYGKSFLRFMHTF